MLKRWANIVIFAANGRHRKLLKSANNQRTDRRIRSTLCLLETEIEASIVARSAGAINNRHQLAWKRLLDSRHVKPRVASVPLLIPHTEITEFYSFPPSQSLSQPSQHLHTKGLKRRTGSVHPSDYMLTHTHHHTPTIDCVSGVRSGVITLR